MRSANTHLLWYPGHDRIMDDIICAEGCELVDSKGKRYVDLESGVWCTSIGHGHARLNDVLCEQSRRIMHAGYIYSSPVVEEAARDILGLLGFSGGRCVFLCSGSEAVEYGVRTTQMIAPRSLLMTMSDSYCGAYGSASQKRKEEWFCFDWSECVDCPESRHCDGTCKRWASIPIDRIGGFVFEPGSSSGLVRFPPEKLIRSIARAMDDVGGVVLVNEVTTGMGRTGMWFGYQHYGITPDIVALGKGVGNGYPVSVTALGPRVLSGLAGRSVNYAQSHQNDPLGAAVVREVIRIMHDDGLVDKGRTSGGMLLQGLEAIQSRCDRIRDIRARGLMVAVELRDDEEAAFTIRTHRELLRRGFIVARRPGLNVLRIDPPLCISRVQIDRFLQSFEEALEK